MKKKIFYILSPVILAVITCIWLFYKDNRWYTYRQEWPFGPLFVLHLLFPLFYLVMFVIMLIRQISKNKRSDSNVFYMLSSVILTVVCTVGFFVFMIFTSGM